MNEHHKYILFIVYKKEMLILKTLINNTFVLIIVYNEK